MVMTWEGLKVKAETDMKEKKRMSTNKINTRLTTEERMRDLFLKFID